MANEGAPKYEAADLSAGDARFAIIVSRFNAHITDNLLQGAIGAHDKQGGDASKRIVVRVPGSFELPTAALKAAKRDDVDAVICLGCVIKGETDHYDQVVNATTLGISQAGLMSGKPVMFGVITAQNLEQAIARSCPAYNLGEHALLAAIDMLSAMKQLD